MKVTTLLNDGIVPFTCSNRDERKAFYDEYVRECQEILQGEKIDIARYLHLLLKVQKIERACEWMKLDDYQSIACYALGDFAEENEPQEEDIAKIYIATKKGTFLPAKYEEWLKALPEMEKECNLEYLTTDDLLTFSLLYSASGNKQKALKYKNLAAESRNKMAENFVIDSKSAIQMGDDGLQMIFSYMLQSVAQRIIIDSLNLNQKLGNGNYFLKTKV